MKCGSMHDHRVQVPEPYTIAAEDIHESVLVFEEEPGLCESCAGRRHIWLVKDQHMEWCHMFPLADSKQLVVIWHLPMMPKG